MFWRRGLGRPANIGTSQMATTIRAGHDHGRGPDHVLLMSILHAYLPSSRECLIGDCNSLTCFLFVQDWSDMDALGEMYVSGVDRSGCPSWTWRACLHDAAFNGTPERGTRYLICMMER
jgi:hypothetical protein